jgi:hypothetical protein
MLVSSASRRVTIFCSVPFLGVGDAVLVSDALLTRMGRHHYRRNAMAAAASTEGARRLTCRIKQTLLAMLRATNVQADGGVGALQQ